MSLLPPPPPKNDKISSAFSYNFKSALTLACLTGQKLSRDRIFVNVIMCDDRDSMQAFRDFLAEHHITNVCCDSYTRDWNRKTITVTAYAETRAESRLIDHYIENSPMKFKRITQKL